MIFQLGRRDVPFPPRPNASQLERPLVSLEDLLLIVVAIFLVLQRRNPHLLPFSFFRRSPCQMRDPYDVQYSLLHFSPFTGLLRKEGHLPHLPQCGYNNTSLPFFVILSLSFSERPTKKYWCVARFPRERELGVFSICAVRPALPGPCELSSPVRTSAQAFSLCQAMSSPPITPRSSSFRSASPHPPRSDGLLTPSPHPARREARLYSAPF